MTLKPNAREFEAALAEQWLEHSPWYQRDYFEARVEHELYRSRRYKVQTTIIFVRVPAVSRRAARAIYTYVSTQLRTIDTVGMMGTGDYVVCLPHTPLAGGVIVADRIRAFLDEYGPLIGVASFGEGGQDFGGLLATAEARIA